MSLEKVIGWILGALGLATIFEIQSLEASTGSEAFRSEIGPTFSAPIKYNKKLFFLSTSGKFFESDLDLKKGKLLYETRLPTMSGPTLIGDDIWFGEGLHADKKSKIYAFNLKSKKLSFQMPINGHVQRDFLGDGENIYFGAGPGGLVALDKNTKKILWKKDKIPQGKIHIDSNIVVYKQQVCVASVYGVKGIICFNKISGDLVQTYPLSHSPKGEISLSGSRLYGMATEANMVKMEWKKEGHLYVIDLAKGKKTLSQKFRGYNFFRPYLLNVDQVFMTLSTGDFLIFDLRTGKVDYVGEFPEPFISSPFVIPGVKKELCSIGIMGQLLCFQRKGKTYVMSRKQRFFESPIGIVKSREMGGKFYFPSRIGYFMLDP